MNKKTIVITTVILAVMIIISTIIKPKYYINLSCSIPRGIYKVIPKVNTTTFTNKKN